MFTLNPKSAWRLVPKLAGVRHQPFGSGCQRRFAGDHKPRSPNLSPGLFSVPPVGKEHASGFSHNQSAGGSRKPAKVSDVREMRNQQCIQMDAVEGGLQLRQAAPVVHAGSVTSGREQRAGGTRRSKLRLYSAITVETLLATSPLVNHLIWVAAKRNSRTKQNRRSLTSGTSGCLYC
jgi:hypothetical protein